jgi:hypothetical protein
MKTARLSPSGGSKHFQLSGGGESLPRLRMARPDFSPSFLRDEPDSYRSLQGFTPDQQHG